MVKKINKLLEFYTQAQLSVILGYSNRSSITFILNGRNNLPKHKNGLVEILLKEVESGVFRKVDPNYILENRTKMIWRGMISRCSNKNTEYYKNGIKVCTRWNDYENFLSDMGEAPDGMSLDRKNGKLGYSKDNCRWATSKEQNINRSNVKLFNFEGELLTKAEIRKRLIMLN